jgi:hypothetical protein
MCETVCYGIRAGQDSYAYTHQTSVGPEGSVVPCCTTCRYLVSPSPGTCINRVSLSILIAT